MPDHTGNDRDRWPRQVAARMWLVTGKAATAPSLADFANSGRTEWPPVAIRSRDLEMDTPDPEAATAKLAELEQTMNDTFAELRTIA